MNPSEFPLEDPPKTFPNIWRDHSANPSNWPESKKWSILSVVAVVTFTVGMNATAVATPSLIIADEFHVSDASFPNSYWPVTVWNTGAAFGPMIGLPLLENFGIQRGFLVRGPGPTNGGRLMLFVKLLYALFSIMVIPQAVAQNFATLLVSRALAGTFGGILQNTMEQFSADLWLTEQERDLPITLYTYVYVAGVTLGPAFGAIVSRLSWRWFFYIQLMIYSAVGLPLLVILRETRGQIVLALHAEKDTSLAKEASDIARTSLTHLLHEAITRPAHLLFTEPVVFFLTLWAAFCFGLVFLMTQSIVQVYSSTYKFGDSASGLVQISLFVGETIGFFACLPQNVYHQRSAKRNPVEPGVPIPEARLPLSVPASLIGLAGGLFWYGWASVPQVHWMLPTIGLAFVGFGIMVIITAVDMYITDAYIKFAGSAIAAVAMGENLFAAWLPLATRSMYTSLGFRWASSLLGFVALLLTLAPIVLIWKGKTIRKKSKFIQAALSS
ncbi:MAG: hypothetical protein Q9216_004352 [Gyalolechia sp. 2 TL-2023]